MFCKICCLSSTLYISHRVCCICHDCFTVFFFCCLWYDMIVCVLIAHKNADIFAFLSDNWSWREIIGLFFLWPVVVRCCMFVDVGDLHRLQCANDTLFIIIIRCRQYERAEELQTKINENCSQRFVTQDWPSPQAAGQCRHWVYVCFCASKPFSQADLL